MLGLCAARPGRGERWLGDGSGWITWAGMKVPWSWPWSGSSRAGQPAALIRSWTFCAIPGAPGGLVRDLERPGREAVAVAGHLRRGPGHDSDAGALTVTREHQHGLRASRRPFARSWCLDWPTSRASRASRSGQVRGPPAWLMTSVGRRITAVCLGSGEDDICAGSGQFRASGDVACFCAQQNCVGAAPGAVLGNLWRQSALPSR